MSSSSPSTVTPQGAGRLPEHRHDLVRGREVGGQGRPRSRVDPASGPRRVGREPPESLDDERTVGLVEANGKNGQRLELRDGEGARGPPERVKEDLLRERPDARVRDERLDRPRLPERFRQTPPGLRERLLERGEEDRFVRKAERPEERANLLRLAVG